MRSPPLPPPPLPPSSLLSFLLFIFGENYSNERQRQSSQLSTALQSAFQSHLHTYLYPHSTISVQVSILSSDGSLLAAAINACTLALVDAGIPMPGLLCGCTAGMSGSASTPREDPTNTNSQHQYENKDEGNVLDPLLDLSLPEEQELPFITIGTTTALPAGSVAAAAEGEEDGDDMKVSVLHMETRAHTSYLDTMLAVGIDGCKQIREILEGVIKGSSTGGVKSVYSVGGEEVESDDGDEDVDEDVDEDEDDDDDDDDDSGGMKL